MLARAVLLAVLASTLLSACVGALVVGGATATATATAVVVADRRSVPQQWRDQRLDYSLQRLAADVVNTATSRISVNTYQHRVLITGEVATQAEKDAVTTLAYQFVDAQEVFNQLQIAPVANTGAQDTWISSKVHSHLLLAKHVPSRTIMVTTSQGVVYLMGQLTQAEAQLAAQVASQVKGVREVVNVFSVMSDAQGKALSEGRTDGGKP